jgi:protocatechuate 3,4-dioxygenase beta subunit
MRMPRRLAVDSLSVLLLALLCLFPSVAGATTTRAPKAAENRGLSTTITGVVVDGKGRPVAGAAVEARGIYPGQPAHTDAAGRFVIPALMDCEEYLLRASHRGFAPEFLSVTPCGTMTGYRLALQPGATVFGTVVDKAGRPVGGARVGLFQESSQGIGEPRPYRSTSGADGRFEIPDLPADRFTLRVSHRDFPLLTRKEIEVSRESRRIDLGRVALPPGKRFQGQVLDPQGHPLAGVRVWALYEVAPVQGANKDLGLDPAAVTGPDGRFEIAGFVPTTFLHFCRPGYQPSRLPVVSPPPQPRRIVLTPAPPLAHVSGRVLDEAGRPVAGARVATENPEGREVRATWDLCEKRRPVSGTTDAQGRFTFDLPRKDDFGLWTEAPGYLPGAREKIPMERAGGGIEIVLRRGATVAGRVLAQDGLPVPGARVYSPQDGKTPQTVTDAQGRYQLDGIEPGGRELWAEHPERGEARRRLELVPGANRLDLTLDGQKERAVAGRVVGPDGEPLAGIRVQTGQSSLYTREDGSFRLVFARGSLLFRAETEHLLFTGEGYAVLDWAFKPSETPIEGLEIRLEKSRRLTGHILGLDSPEDLASVNIGADGAGGMRLGRVNPDGTYQIDGLGPGPWAVEATFRTRVARATVKIDHGEASLDLEIPRLAEIRGKVLAPDGSPVSRAEIEFQNRAEKSESLYRSSIATSQADGTFSIEIQAGSYAVQARAEPYATAFLERPLTVGAAPIVDLEMRLNIGSTLRGRILGMPYGASASLSFAQEEVWRPAAVEPDGTYRCSGLEPGEWQVDGVVGTEPDGGENTGMERVPRTVRTRVTLASGAPEAVLDLPLGDLTLAGRLTSGDEPLSTQVSLLKADGEVISTGTVVEDEEGGSFRFPGLLPGRYILKIEDYYRDRVVERPIDLPSSQEMTIDLLEKDR